MGAYKDKHSVRNPLTRRASTGIYPHSSFPELIARIKLSGKGKSHLLQGWYNHPSRHRNEEEEEDEIGSHTEAVQVDYKEQYKRLKRKLKFLIYENECYQENLRASRAKLLEIARDRSFLLDRLLQYEKVDVSSSSESGEDTESSDGETDLPRQDLKRKRSESNSHHPHSSHSHVVPSPATKNPTAAKKKKASNKSSSKQTLPPTVPGALSYTPSASASLASDGHMTPEEVERHLSARGHSFMELLPERAPPTVPTEMFSNDLSLDSESNDLETSPSNLGEDCLSVDMIGD